MITLNALDYIGNSLSSININFNELEYWTNNIQLSSDKYYKPLVNFYDFYRDFWKSSVSFAKSINAIERLKSFSTTVENNSAKFIKPIVILYPDVFEYNIMFVNYKNIVENWFKIKYPVINKINNVTNFVQNSVAYICVMFYDEFVRINNTIDNNNRVKIIDPVGCVTNDVTVTVKCLVTYAGNVSCGSSGDVCGSIRTVCTNTKTATCFYENDQKTITRNGIMNIDQYFKDRCEHNKIYIIMMKVEGCEWVFKKIIPYDNISI